MFIRESFLDFKSKYQQWSESGTWITSSPVTMSRRIEVYFKFAGDFRQVSRTDFGKASAMKFPYPRRQTFRAETYTIMDAHTRRVVQVQRKRWSLGWCARSMHRRGCTHVCSQPLSLCACSPAPFHRKRSHLIPPRLR